mmetsp:Transcript_25392/g.60392  ORF Transcript_25392/g.60392 Transcript_25392/m.60392 type:complete len:216 (-) Transcript_25392:467-1114(-)
MPSMSNVQFRRLRLCVVGRRLVATHCATVSEKPCAARNSRSVLRLRSGIGTSRSLLMRRLGWSGESSERISPGRASSTHTWAGRGSRDLPAQNCCAMERTTLPPKEWPMSRRGKSLSCERSRRTSAAAASTVLGSGQGRLAEPPWLRRSTSSTCQDGKTSTRRRARLCRLRFEPMIPCTSTAVGGGCSARLLLGAQVTWEPATISCARVGSENVR